MFLYLICVAFATVTFEGDIVSNAIEARHLTGQTLNITGSASEAHHLVSVPDAQSKFLSAPLVYLQLEKTSAQILTVGGQYAIHSWTTIENDFGFGLPSASNEGVTVPYEGVYLIDFGSQAFNLYYLTVNDASPSSSSMKYGLVHVEGAFVVQLTLKAGDVVYIWVYGIQPVASCGNQPCVCGPSANQACHFAMVRVGY